MRQGVGVAKTAYKTLPKNQGAIWEELKQIKAKMAILGSLRRFEEVAKRGRAFAKAKGIKQADVFNDD